MELSRSIEFYVIVNQEGQYFRSKGYNGYGNNWVDEIDNAKFYTKIGQARSRVTYFATNYPDFGIPYIIKITAKEGEIINEEERVIKSIKNKEIREKQYQVNRIKDEVKRAEEKLLQAQQNLNQVKSKL